MSRTPNPPGSHPEDHKSEPRTARAGREDAHEREEQRAARAVSPTVARATGVIPADDEHDLVDLDDDDLRDMEGPDA